MQKASRFSQFGSVCSLKRTWQTTALAFNAIKKLRLAGVACLMAFVTSFVSTRAAAQADPNKVLKYAFEIAETGFDPAQISDWYSSIVNEQIFDTPLRYDYLARPLKMKPNVLEALPEISADGTVYTLRFRKGIYFADDAAFGGKKRELVANDLVYTMKRLFDPKVKSPNLYFLDGKIAGMEPLKKKAKETGKFDFDMASEGFELVDRYTLKIKLLQADYNFSYLLASVNSSAIVAREVVEKYADDIMAHPVGTGPYRLTAWKRSSRIILEANPNFREMIFDDEPPAEDAVKQAIAMKLKGKRLPMIGRIEIYPIEEEQPRWLAFLNKEHDFIDRVPNDYANHAFPGNKLAAYLSKDGIQMDRQPGLEVTYAYFAMENPVVGGYTPEKVALRRAVVLGYNTDDEIRIIRKNQAVPAQSPVGPGAFGFEPDFRTTANEFDPARARGLLDMFGYLDRDGDGYRENPDGSKLELELATTPTQRDKQFDELWKKSMDAIGIKMRIKKARWPELLKESRAGKLMMWQLGWSGPYPDAEAFFVMLYGPNSGQANHARFKNAEFDRLFEKARMTPPSPERMAIYRDMNRLFLVNAPWKLGGNRMLTDLSHPWLIGHTRHPVNRATFRYLDIDLEMQSKLKK